MVKRFERFTNTHSPWFDELQGRFEELFALPQGWDGYAGRPVSFACAHFAANLIDSLYVEGIRAPQIVPGSDGTLQFEWHENQIDLEVDVLAHNNVIGSLTDHRTGDDREVEFQTDFSELAGWVGRLARTRAPHIFG